MSNPNTYTFSLTQVKQIIFNQSITDILCAHDIKNALFFTGYSWTPSQRYNDNNKLPCLNAFNALERVFCVVNAGTGDAAVECWWEGWKTLRVYHPSHHLPTGGGTTSCLPLHSAAAFLPRTQSVRRGRANRSNMTCQILRFTRGSDRSCCDLHFKFLMN